MEEIQKKNLLTVIPKLHSFIVVRRESFGGFIFNPYFLDPIPMNEIGLRIIELSDGSRSVLEIIKKLCQEFSLPFKVLKSTVLDALNTFKNYFALNYVTEKSPDPLYPKIELSIENKNSLSAPLTILWDITYACNLRCKHCLVSAGERLKDELTLKEVRDIIDQLINMKVFNICFLGGEPLIREDFLKILSYASKWNIGITFSTNGSLIDDYVIKKLESLKIFQVQVSLDGMENTHNKIRGDNSSFQAAVQAIKKLVKSGIQVGVSTTITKLNLKELNKLIQLSISLGANYFKAIPFIPVGRGINNESLILQPEDVKEYISILFERKEKEEKKIHIYAEETYSWLLDAPPKPSIISSMKKKISCVAGNSQLVISPNGLVYPCPFLHTFIAGDLRKQKLSTIWSKSKVLKLFRDMKIKKLKGKCKDCPYIPIRCTGGCRAAALNMSGDFYAEDPLCWYNPP